MKRSRLTRRTPLRSRARRDWEPPPRPPTPRPTRRANQWDRSPTVEPRPREAPTRLPPADAAALRARVRDEANGWCARCSTAAAHGHAHHLLPRSAGGADADDNLAWLCPPCHEWAHANPAEAYATGWLRRRGTVRNQGEVPT